MDDLLEKVLGLGKSGLNYIKDNAVSFALPFVPTKQSRQSFRNFLDNNKFLNSPTPNPKDDPNLTVKQAAKQIIPTLPKSFGDFYRQRVPLIGDLIGRTAETVGSGVTDLGTAAFNLSSKPNLNIGDIVKNTAGGVYGAGKLATVAIPHSNLFFQSAGIASKSPQKDVASLAARTQEVMTGIKDLASTTPRANHKYNVFGKDIEFDPAGTVGTMIGFVKNPVNKQIFGATDEINLIRNATTRSAKLANFLATNSVRGGIEDFLMNLKDIPDDATPAEKAKFIRDRVIFGAESEIGGRAVFSGLQRTLDNKIVATVFDTLKGALKESGVDTAARNLYETLQPRRVGGQYDFKPKSEPVFPSDIREPGRNIRLISKDGSPTLKVDRRYGSKAFEPSGGGIKRELSQSALGVVAGVETERDENGRLKLNIDPAKAIAGVTVAGLLSSGGKIPEELLGLAKEARNMSKEDFVKQYDYLFDQKPDNYFKGSVEEFYNEAVKTAKSIIPKVDELLSPASKETRLQELQNTLETGRKTAEGEIPKLPPAGTPPNGAGAETAGDANLNVSPRALDLDTLFSKKVETPEITPRGGDLTPISEVINAKKAGATPEVDLSNKPQQLNVQKLNLDDEGKTLVRSLEDTEPRQVLKNKDIKAESDLVEPKNVSRKLQDTTKVAAQDLATRRKVVADTKKYFDLKKSGASQKELEAQMLKIAKTSKVSREQGTDIARQLQARNILADESATPMQRVFKLLDNAGVDQKKYIKEAVNVDWGNANSVVTFYRKFIPPTFAETLDEFRYTNMLSSPNTQIVNTFSNLVQSGVVTPIEKTVAGVLDYAKSALTGSERQYYASQGIDYTKGYVKALPEAVDAFKKAFSGEQEITNLDLKGKIPTGTGGFRKAYTTPLRLLEASDQFFRTLVKGGEIESLARAGITGKEAIAKAEQSADYRLFRQAFDPEGKLGQGGVLKAWDKWNSAIGRLRNAPGGKWIVPFLQTPTNILKQGVEYSPLGFATAPGAKEPTVQIAKALVGSGVFVAAYSLAEAGLTTWDTPTSKKEKDAFYAAGLQPYSIKIGNKWVSYSKLGPLSYPIAMAAAIKNGKDNGLSDSELVNSMVGLAGIFPFFADQSYMQGIGDIIDAVRGDEFKRDRAISNIPLQLIPYRSFQGWVARMVDPVYRKATGSNIPETVLNSIKSQTPFLSKTLPAYQTPTGEDSPRQFPFFNAVSPLKVTQENEFEASQYNKGRSLKVQEKRAKAALEKQEGGSAAVGNKYIYYDESGEIKTIDLTKFENMKEDSAVNKALKKKKAYELVDDVLDNLQGDDQEAALEKLGIEKDEAEYYNIARQPDSIKTVAVEDMIISTAESHEDLLNKLIQGRLAVNDKMLVSNGVIDDLYEAGYITKSERTQLKKIKIRQNGDIEDTYKSSGSSKAAKAIKKAKEEALKGFGDISQEIIKGAPIKSVDALIRDLNNTSEYKPASIPKLSVNPTLQSGNIKRTTVPSVQDLFSQLKPPTPSITSARDLFARGGSPTAKTLSLSRSSYRPTL